MRGVELARCVRPDPLGAEEHRSRAPARFAHDPRSGIARRPPRGSTGRASVRSWPTTKPQPASASASVSTTRALASTSSAPEARAVASLCGNCSRTARARSSLEPHVLHRAGHGADVAGMRGLDQNDADVSGVHRICCRHALIALFSRSQTRSRGSPCIRCLNIAVRAARRAGEVIVRSLNRLRVARRHARRAATTSSAKSTARPSARSSRSIRQHYPNHAILAEESGRSGETTTPSGSSIRSTARRTSCTAFRSTRRVDRAASSKGRLEQRVVYDPMRQELFTATRGGGAHLDDRRIRVSKQRTARRRARSAPASRFARTCSYIDAYLAMLKAVMQQTAGMRRPGAAALDLAYVAAGRIDAFLGDRACRPGTSPPAPCSSRRPAAASAG